MSETSGDASLKARIRDYVARTDHVTFAELQNRFGGFTGGDHEFSLQENLIVWSGMTEEAAAAVTELITEKAIHMQSTVMLTYLIDGCALRLPIPKRRRSSGFKKPHWLPVTLRPGPDPKRKAKAA